MTEKRNSILAGVTFGLLFGLFLAFRSEMEDAFIAGPISGFAFGFGVYFFMTAKPVKQQTQIEHKDGEPVIRSGGANRFKNLEAVGGKLYVIQDKLQFQSHNFNVQNHGKVINLNQIKEVEVYNTFGMIPNGLKIKKHDGQIEKFVVSDRRIWKEEIEKLQAGEKLE